MAKQPQQAWVPPANHATPVLNGAEHIRQRVVTRQCCSAGGGLVTLILVATRTVSNGGFEKPLVSPSFRRRPEAFFNSEAGRPVPVLFRKLRVLGYSLRSHLRGSSSSVLRALRLSCLRRDDGRGKRVFEVL